MPKLKTFRSDYSWRGHDSKEIKAKNKAEAHKLVYDQIADSVDGWTLEIEEPVEIDEDEEEFDPNWKVPTIDVV